MYTLSEAGFFIEVFTLALFVVRFIYLTFFYNAVPEYCAQLERG